MPNFSSGCSVFKGCSMSELQSTQLPISLVRPPGYKRKAGNANAVPAQRNATGRPVRVRRIRPLYAPLSLLKRSGLGPLPRCNQILSGIRSYKGQGSKTHACISNDIPYLINAFWRPNAGGSHPIQKGPYHACFSGNLAAFCIERFSPVGGIVHDPCGGRGTTAIQSALMGRIAYSTDINPLSLMMTRPRLRAITTDDIRAKLKTLDLQLKPIEHEDMLVFFHPQTLQQLEAMRRALAQFAPVDDAHPDPIWDWIRMAILFRLTGHTSAYLSRETVQPNAPTPTIAAQRRRNERSGLTAPERDLDEIIIARSKGFLRHGCVPNTHGHKLAVGAAWDTPWIADGTVDLTLTSPPFADVVDYAKDNWVRAWFAGVSLEDVGFSHHKSLTDWTNMVRRILIEQIRVVKPGGYIAIEVGEIRGGQVELERFVWDAAEGLPCKRICVVVNQQAFTKSAHTLGVTNGENGTNSNRIVILQRS
ncbi:DNA methyltransferase [Marivita sp. S0852]|uniref:DNA methyltransferase n=1 Tax=Marivita sp. S0852 TaxID=3373893 RepID=UPI003981FFA9